MAIDHKTAASLGAIGTGFGTGYIDTTSAFPPGNAMEQFKMNSELEMRRMQAQIEQMKAEGLMIQFSVHKAENGYILKAKSRTYIMQTIDDLADQIKAVMVAEKFEEEGKNASQMASKMAR